MSVNHPQVSIFDLLGAARRARAGGGAPKATLLALVERMGDRDGEWSCWPSQETLAFDSEQTERSVRNHLADFEAKGLIGRRQRSRGRGNVYVLNVPALFAAALEGDKLRPEPRSGEPNADRNVGAPVTGTPVPPEVPGKNKQPPNPPQAGGASSHDGNHRNCRECGTNRRGPKPPPTPAPDHPANRKAARDANPCQQCDGVGRVEVLDGTWPSCPRCKGSGVEPSRRVS